MNTGKAPQAEADGKRPAPSLAVLSDFAGINPDDLKLLDEKTTAIRVRRGNVLVRQDDPPENLYLVVSGRFFVMPEGKQEAIAEIGPGEPIGELAFLAGVRRTANVIAARDSEVLVLTRAAYAEVTRQFPGILVTILAAVAKRLARVTGASPALRRRPPRTIALLPIGGDTRLPERFVPALAEAMAPALVAPVSSSTFSDSAGAVDIDELHNHLATLENSVDLVLFALDRLDTPFSRVCLSLADQLVLVAPASDTGSSATEVSRIERQTTDLFLKSHRTLVVLRDHQEAPTTGTATWLDQRDVFLHHHAALSDRRDLQRLGRFFTGTARGLVMGGGAALGCAHLGVAKALYESGTSIDFFGGTSVGAAMGAALAMGWSPDEVMDRTEDMFVTHRAMHRLTIPLYSLLDHRVIDSILRRNLKGFDVEDLPFNFYAVSTNLTTNAIHVHRRGAAWEAVRASAAIPGVLSPFITETGDVLVDGGLVDNLPISVMRDLKSGPNVVVSLRRSEPWRVSVRYEELPTRRTILRDLLIYRRRTSYPSMATVLIHGLTMESERRRERVVEDDDLFVMPRGTEGIGFQDWHKGRELADTAYHHMAEKLEEAGSFEALFHPAAEVA